MSDRAESAEEAQQGRKCRACGGLIVAVDEESEKVMMANHVLEEHREEAEPELIEQCEEVLSP